MPKKAAFITVHGMGRTNLNYNQEIVQNLKRRLGSLSDCFYMEKVYYQDILQSNKAGARLDQEAPIATVDALPNDASSLTRKHFSATCGRRCD